MTGAHASSDEHPGRRINRGAPVFDPPANPPATAKPPTTRVGKRQGRLLDGILSGRMGAA